MRRASRKDPGFIPSTDELASRPINFHETGQSLALEDVIDAAGDLIEGWLFDAAKEIASHNKRHDGFSLIDIARRAVAYYSVQRGLHNLWQQALWEAWHIDGAKGKMLWMPEDPKLATMFHAWLIRARSNSAEQYFLEEDIWRNFPREVRRKLSLRRTVVRLERQRGKSSRLIVDRPRALDKVPHYAMSRANLEASYLGDFLDQRFPKNPELSCEILLRAWYIIADAVQFLLGDVAGREFDNVNDVRGWACVLRRSDLVSVLIDALECTKQVSECVVEFLTWAPGVYKGLWGAPIVQIPGRQEVCLAGAILKGANMIRSAEIWMEKGGLSDSLAAHSRGESYEAGLRKKMLAKLQGNILLNDYSMVNFAIKKSKNFPEEIDLLIRLGSLLIVGEVKCFLFPSDPREKFNHLKKLEKAAGQALNKASAVKSNKHYIASLLGVDRSKMENMKIVPLVVVNQGFGTSLMIGGCRITDEKFLSLYLGSGSYYGNAIKVANEGLYPISEDIYSSQREAEETFEAMLENPPPLKRFIDRLQWSSFPFPTASGEPLKCATTILSDLSVEERRFAENTVRAIKQSSHQ
ncbi:hypothetical protein [Methylobacterium currus]|uniref:hypothetical protein n=1 Tax=Methylobacterium currus TaxID=2051553 RepID=UPI000F501406|nr:hypothetical protein [Methylobacterium currus]